MAGESAPGLFDQFVGNVLRPIGIAGAFVLVAFLWTLVLQHLVAYPFLFLFLGAVMGSAWFGGRVAGAISVVLSTAMIDYFFVPPFYSFYVNNVAQTYCIAFIVCAITMSWVSSARKRNETTIKDARDQLEQRVLERTADLQRSNAEIQESERRLRTLTEAIPQQIWSAGLHGRIDYCNNHLLEYVGCEFEDLKNEGFFLILHPEDRETFRTAWQKSRAAGDNLEGEWRVRGANGNYRWFLIRSVPQKSANGEIERWYGTHIDTEERRRAEQALIQAQAELSDLSHRLGMGELAASIAHELNQPLTAVVANAYACREWLQASPPNLDRASSTAQRIVQESKRASDVVARVRALFRKDIDSRSSVDVNRLIQDLVRLLHDDAIRKRISLHINLDKSLPRVTADPVQIQQVLLNLATNGMDAMTSQPARRDLVISSLWQGEDKIQIQVKDWGAGVDPEIAGRIFDPFFTTKKEGIGMGLAISRTIIEAHDGRIWMSQDATGGSCFHFTIPVRT
ncbi:MAG: ATP-binding protein [Acidobacteriota bacterium]|nr:ATP-binding protein [Acidobacteriota bacterium]